MSTKAASKHEESFTPDTLKKNVRVDIEKTVMDYQAQSSEKTEHKINPNQQKHQRQKSPFTKSKTDGKAAARGAANRIKQKNATLKKKFEAEMNSLILQQPSSIDAIHVARLLSPRMQEDTPFKPDVQRYSRDDHRVQTILKTERIALVLAVDTPNTCYYCLDTSTVNCQLPDHLKKDRLLYRRYFAFFFDTIALKIEEESMVDAHFVRMEKPKGYHSHEKASARLIGSTTAGVLEVLIFHPIDTIAKRLMTNTTSVRADVQHTKMDHVARVVFKGAYDQPALQRYISLFPGLGFATGYKVLQRIYKFGGQPVLKDLLDSHYGHDFRTRFGKSYGSTLIDACAGSLIGIGEVVLLPLDVLKIRAQTNPGALSGRGILQLIQTEGSALYRGVAWTIGRNAPGSFALFGGSAACKQYFFGLDNNHRTTLLQTLGASTMGAILSILVAQPMDVIKTRIQSNSDVIPKSGFQIICTMLQNEGISGLFKGLVPKLTIVGPKLIFSFTVAQQIISTMEEILI